MGAIRPPAVAGLGGRAGGAARRCLPPDPPIPFQGAAMALEDAWVLAAELDAAADLDQGLRAYTARRPAEDESGAGGVGEVGRLYHLQARGRQEAQLGLRRRARSRRACCSAGSTGCSGRT